MLPLRAAAAAILAAAVCACARGSAGTGGASPGAGTAASGGAPPPGIYDRDSLAASPAARAAVPFAARAVAPDSGERHFAALRQLTDGGENAEAYFSADGRQLIFQSTRDGRTCDQQYVMNADGTGLRRVSTGRGKTTCGYFMEPWGAGGAGAGRTAGQAGRRIFFASSHAVDSACPPRPDPSQGYVWRLDPFDIYTANVDGSALARLTSYGVYTAEGVLSPDGRTIVFTSLKDGDLDIYTMSVDGSDVRRLTTTPGYDGGPWWSPDGRRIVYRAHHPKDSADLASYRALLAQRLVRPNRMDIWVMDADGGNQRQVTDLGAASFGPSWTPDGRRIVFSSNHHTNPRLGNFDLFLVNADGTGLEQLTTSPVFDGFPMFSPDGRQLVWASNRHARTRGETNLFVADWRD
jgi:Tol biopolymer transport system component